MMVDEKVELKCEVCGCGENETSALYGKRSGKILCHKHYLQIRNYGRILNITVFDPNEIILYDDYAEIVLYNRKHLESGRAIIDLEDVEKCKNHKWNLDKRGYAVSKLYNPLSSLKLHRLIINVANVMDVDHINRNKLDNRKSNLRVCSHQENSCNNSLYKNNKSGVTGVHWLTRESKWCAEIKLNYKKIPLGYFDDINEAKRARREAELKYFGEFAPIHND